MFRKAAYKIVDESPEENLKVTEDNLVDYVGNPVFSNDMLYETTPPGVVTGLAYTAMGTNI